ncbi:MAG: XRE family transcriptional regulator [Defluviitaleaceae bacterium]|nr:XRE family transcriptional regulator [Defluviitaleaceae bacterium]
MKNITFNGDRLKKARIYNGYTIKEVADGVECSRQAISTYENGKELNPDLGIIKRLADFLKFPLSFFYEQSLDYEGESKSVYFRSQLTTKPRYRKQQVAKIAIVATIYDFVSQYIDFNSPELPKLSNSNEPETLAAELRHHWRLGEKPIENIVHIVEGKGIIVNEFTSDTTAIDACSHMVDLNGSGRFLIGYSSNNLSASRIHFDVAHELGHIFMHEFTEDVEALSKEEFREREREAHSFASAFLLPKESFLNDLYSVPFSIPGYTRLKMKWNVSIAAMVRRAYDLGAIPYDDYQKMMMTLAKRGLRKDEPLDAELITSSPSLLKSAVKMLLDENIFTSREFIDELSYSHSLTLFPSMIEELLNLPEGTLSSSGSSHHLKLIKGNSPN